MLFDIRCLLQTDSAGISLPEGMYLISGLLPSLSPLIYICVVFLLTPTPF